MLSAGVVMGIMIIPYVSSLSEDAMRAVPMSLREGAYALGANRIITSLKVVSNVASPLAFVVTVTLLLIALPVAFPKVGIPFWGAVAALAWVLVIR